MSRPPFTGAEKEVYESFKILNIEASSANKRTRFVSIRFEIHDGVMAIKWMKALCMSSNLTKGSPCNRNSKV